MGLRNQGSALHAGPRQLHLVLVRRTVGSQHTIVSQHGPAELCTGTDLGIGEPSTIIPQHHQAQLTTAPGCSE